MVGDMVSRQRITSLIIQFTSTHNISGALVIHLKYESVTVDHPQARFFQLSDLPALVDVSMPSSGQSNASNNLSTYLVHLHHIVFFKLSADRVDDRVPQVKQL